MTFSGGNFILKHELNLCYGLLLTKVTKNMNSKFWVSYEKHPWKVAKLFFAGKYPPSSRKNFEANSRDLTYHHGLI